MGLPRPWDQQWSLRMQQILAFETDLLEFDDIFDGNKNVFNLFNHIFKEENIDFEDEIVNGSMLLNKGQINNSILRLSSTNNIAENNIKYQFKKRGIEEGKIIFSTDLALEIKHL